MLFECACSVSVICILPLLDCFVTFTLSKQNTVQYLSEMSLGAPMRYLAADASAAARAATGSEGFPFFLGLGILSWKTYFSKAANINAAIAMTNAGAVNWVRYTHSPRIGIRLSPMTNDRNPPTNGIQVKPVYCTALLVRGEDDGRGRNQDGLDAVIG